jgi:hypothetical protein
LGRKNERKWPCKRGAVEPFHKKKPIIIELGHTKKTRPSSSALARASSTNTTPSLAHLRDVLEPIAQDAEEEDLVRGREREAAERRLFLKRVRALLPFYLATSSSRCALLRESADS